MSVKAKRWQLTIKTSNLQLSISIKWEQNSRQGLGYLEQDMPLFDPLDCSHEARPTYCYVHTYIQRIGPRTFCSVCHYPNKPVGSIPRPTIIKIRSFISFCESKPTENQYMKSQIWTYRVFNHYFDHDILWTYSIKTQLN